MRIDLLATFIRVQKRLAIHLSWCESCLLLRYVFWLPLQLGNCGKFEMKKSISTAKGNTCQDDTAFRNYNCGKLQAYIYIVIRSIQTYDQALETGRESTGPGSCWLLPTSLHFPSRMWPASSMSSALSWPPLLRPPFLGLAEIDLLWKTEITCSRSPNLRPSHLQPRERKKQNSVAFPQKIETVKLRKIERQKRHHIE